MFSRNVSSLPSVCIVIPYNAIRHVTVESNKLARPTMQRVWVSVETEGPIATSFIDTEDPARFETEGPAETNLQPVWTINETRDYRRIPIVIYCAFVCSLQFLKKFKTENNKDRNIVYVISARLSAALDHSAISRPPVPRRSLVLCQGGCPRSSAWGFCFSVTASRGLNVSLMCPGIPSVFY